LQVVERGRELLQHGDHPFLQLLLEEALAGLGPNGAGRVLAHLVQQDALDALQHLLLRVGDAVRQLRLDHRRVRRAQLPRVRGLVGVHAHHLDELVVVDLAVVVLVDLRDHGVELLLRHLLPELLQDGLQLARVDAAAAVRVEVVEGLLEPRDLLCGEPHVSLRALC
jgi:hypothetical protein